MGILDIKFSMRMPSHIPTEFSNLKTMFIPPNCTGKLQPLDCSILATVKNQYYSWLMKETVARGPENINLEMAVISMAISSTAWM